MRYPVAINWCEHCKFDKMCVLKYHGMEREEDCPHYREGPAIEPIKFTKKRILHTLGKLTAEWMEESLEDEEQYKSDEIDQITDFRAVVMTRDRDYLNMNFLSQFVCCRNCGKRLLSDSEIDEVISKYRPRRCGELLALLDERLAAKGFIKRGAEVESVQPLCCSENCRELYLNRIRMEIARLLEETEKGCVTESLSDVTP